MATPTLLQIDDRNPLVFYSPNSSWTRGGNVADFDATSTFTSTFGSSATLTFTGTGISVWGTIQYLVPNTSTYVLSSYSVDGGPTTIFNATEMASFQFQQKLFETTTLTDSGTHTIVVTLVNSGSLFIDYFLIIPSGATSTSASSSNPSSLTGTMTVAGVDASTLSSTTTGAGAQPHSSRVSLASSESLNTSSLTDATITLTGADSPTLSSTTASAGAQSHSSRVSLGPAVGGTLGGLVLLIIAILAFLLCFKRRKDKNLHDSQAAQVSPDPFINPSSRPLPMQQYQPYEGSDSIVSDHQSYSPQLTTPPTTALGAILPSSKAAQLSIPSRRGDSLHSRPFSDSPEPPGYVE